MQHTCFVFVEMSQRGCDFLGWLNVLCLYNFLLLPISQMAPKGATGFGQAIPTMEKTKLTGECLGVELLKYSWPSEKIDMQLTQKKILSSNDLKATEENFTHKTMKLFPSAVFVSPCITWWQVCSMELARVFSTTSMPS